METLKRKTASRALDAEVGERVHMLMWREGITLKTMAERIGVDATGLGKEAEGPQRLRPSGGRRPRAGA